ncbi:hypothetical protein ACIPVK_13735 [Paeniglutamicibacter sp. MACA_103]|uniref:hypothetical protein n=1 Tax=Paeniglutamicibacter sp. MACA_103 TaxID=3377337 RepID=UPI0038946625
MLPTIHATARLSTGAPAGLLQDPAVLDPGCAAGFAAGLSCKRTGVGMVASENHAEDSIQSLTPHGDDHQEIVRDTPPKHRYPSGRQQHEQQ